MLTIPASSSVGRGRRHYLPSRGDAWRPLPLTPALFSTSLDSKRQQLMPAQHEQIKSDKAMSLTAQQANEPSIHRPKLHKRRIMAAFLSIVFPDTGDDDESDYVPSESEEDCDSISSEEEVAAATFEELQDEKVKSHVNLNDDTRWWKTDEDKRQWEKRYRRADAAFRSRFGFAIDTPAHPETRKRVKLKKTPNTLYNFVLASVVIVSLVQLALIYSTSSWAFSMVAWRSINSKIDTNNETLVDVTRGGKTDSVSDHLVSPSHLQIPDHVRTGLYLCSTLSRRVVTSNHDVTVTQHALRACEIAVTFAPLHSYEAIEAHVLRGDLRSLLLLFDGADEDYKAAMSLVLEAETSSSKLVLEPELSQHLDLKLVANHWTQLYTDTKFKELRHEAKARVALTAEQSGNSNALNAVVKLAMDWISAFKREKPVLDVLTHQRSWTLRPLQYQVPNDDDSGQ